MVTDDCFLDPVDFEDTIEEDEADATAGLGLATLAAATAAAAFLATLDNRADFMLSTILFGGVDATTVLATFRPRAGNSSVSSLKSFLMCFESP